MKRIWRAYRPMAGGLLVLDMCLLLSRSLGRVCDAPMKVVFKAANFPSGFLYFPIEAKSNPWWSATFGKSSWILNDELGPMILLLIIVAVQAAVLTALISGFRKLAANKRAAAIISAGPGIARPLC